MAWLPPSPPTPPNYITPAGFKRLADELIRLRTVDRPKVVQEVSDAAAQGDRSENAEYTYGKRRLREIDQRVRHLRQRLDGMVIVEQPPSDPRRVFFGARVTLVSPDGAQRRQRIVGPDEFDAAPDYISMDAPLARALLGRRLDDEVRVELAAGPVSYTIVGIEYPANDPD